MHNESNNEHKDSAPPGNSPQSHSPSAKSNNGSRKRAHSSDADDHPEHIKKRACNECRQQKLKCDVVSEPFQRCSRCNRLKLDCRIDASFKRVGKRSKTAQMEKEIVELKKKLANKETENTLSPTAISPSTELSTSISHLGTVSVVSIPHQGMARSLLDLRNSTDVSAARTPTEVTVTSKTLGGIELAPTTIQSLFKKYFLHYHPFLPILDPEKSPEHFHELSPLLFYTVIIVAARRSEMDPTLLACLSIPFREMVWSTISQVPQNYHVVKALAILCMWPLPTKSTSTDQTFMLSGLMMQIALQTGLHRPSYAQDFSRAKIELKEEDIRDRLQTWAVCNIVAQQVSTSYGQIPCTHYDWTLTSLSEPSTDGVGLAAEIYWRLQIERFSNKVSQMLYNNKSDPIGVAGAQERAAWITLLEEDYNDLQQQITRHASSIALLHLHAAGLHLRLSTFFDPPSAPNYVTDLIQLHFAATAFLDSARQLDVTAKSSLKYATRYIVLIALAGGFTFMKLLNSFFARHIDVEKSRMLFNTTVYGIRSASIANNDLEGRLAEVLTQLWRTYGAGMRKQLGGVDNVLQLKLRRRMSMSLVYDSVWRWREEFQFNGDGTTTILDSAMNNPTDPEIEGQDGNAAAMMADMTLPSAGLNDPLVDYNYEVFDPLTWMLDGSMDMPGAGTDMTDLNGERLFG